MNKLNKKKIGRIILVIGLLLSMISFNKMMKPGFDAYPVHYIYSQLSFSAEIIKSHLSLMSTQNIQLYKQAQYFDSLFALSYGALLFFAVWFTKGKFEQKSKGEQISKKIAITGIIVAVMDILENFLIILMVTQYPIIQPSIVVIHSIFAIVKFICMFLGWTFVVIVNIFMKKSKNNIIPEQSTEKSVSIKIS